CVVFHGATVPHGVATLSLHDALPIWQDLRQELERQGIAVRGASWRGLAEEAPDAYKDISLVIEATVGAGLGRPVARLAPLGVVRSEEHTSELQSRENLVCRLLLEKKK